MIRCIDEDKKSSRAEDLFTRPLALPATNGRPLLSVGGLQGLGPVTQNSRAHLQSTRPLSAATRKAPRLAPRGGSRGRTYSEVHRQHARVHRRTVKHASCGSGIQSDWNCKKKRNLKTYVWQGIWTPVRRMIGTKSGHNSLM